MTKEEIMTRCRKVAIKVDGRQIFGVPDAPYQSVEAYRIKDLAENNMQDSRTGASADLPVMQRVCEFYLVPVSKIDLAV